MILDGEYARRKMWSNVGLQSNKGPAWGNMGRTFIRAVLELLAQHLTATTTLPQAAAARRIQGFHELDGIEFMARIDVEKDGRGELPSNVVKIAVEPGEPGYSSSGAPAVPAVLPPPIKPLLPAAHQPIVLLLRLNAHLSRASRAWAQ